jgi:predicted TIM-barrel fold metal-dependent hydrolase
VEEEQLSELIGQWTSLASEKNLLRHMDKAGIAKMVMLAIDLEVGLGRAEKSLVDQHQDYSGLSERHPTRFVAYCGVDPQRGQYAYDFFEMSLREQRVRGLKLHATTGFVASDPCAYPLYEIAQQWEVPVFIHCGTEFPPLRSGQGINSAFTVDAPASDFPKVKFVLVHAGTGSMLPLQSPWIDGMVYMASYHRNVYMDLASKQRTYTESPLEFYQSLRKLMDSVPVTRILFGSDYPYHELTLPLADWVRVFREPDPHILRQANVSLKAQEMEAILSRNATDELGL